MKYRLLSLGIILLVCSSSRAEPSGAVAGKPIQLPYQITDQQGNTWLFNPDGSLGQTEQNLFTSGGRLTVDGAQYGNGTNQASFDSRHNTLSFPAATMSGLKVSRRVDLNPARGWCRFVELLENPTAAPVRSPVQLVFEFAQAVQSNQPLIDEKKTKRQVGAALWDGTHAAGMLACGRGNAAAPQFAFEGQQLTVAYNVEVPARHTIAILHVQAIRGSAEEALTLLKQTKESEFLAGLPDQILKLIVNFTRPGQFVGDTEILRGNLIDVIELRGGDQYRGTIENPDYKLQTFYGPVDLPASRVIAMLTVGEWRPTQLVITSDGEMFGGALQSHGIHLRLSSGQTTCVPISSITRLGYRKRPDEPDEWKFQSPQVWLQGGDRINVELPPSTLRVATRYGTVELNPKFVATLLFQSEDHAVHEITLTDGSHFAGVVQGEQFELKPRNVAGGRAVLFPATSIVKMQLAPQPPEPDDAAPLLALTNGDRFVGTVAGKFVLETPFDAIEVDGAEVRAMRRAAAAHELQVTLWDGATLSGRMKGDAIAAALQCGQAVTVPIVLLDQYANPEPTPPQQMIDRIRAVVEELAALDEARRERAENQLRELGPLVEGVLKSLRDGSPPEAQRHIDKIVAEFEEARKPPPPPPPADADDGAAVPVK